MRYRSTSVQEPVAPGITQAEKAEKPSTAPAQAKHPLNSAKPVVLPAPAVQGICMTCRHAAKCLFVRATRQPIQFCDEFDAGG